MLEKIFKLKENGTTVRTEVIAGLTTIHEYGFGGSILSIIMSIAAAAIILFIGILVFTMLERMISFFSSVFEELMRRL